MVQKLFPFSQYFFINNGKYCVCYQTTNSIIPYENLAKHMQIPTPSLTYIGSSASPTTNDDARSEHKNPTVQRKVKCVTKNQMYVTQLHTYILVCVLKGNLKQATRQGQRTIATIKMLDLGRGIPSRKEVRYLPKRWCWQWGIIWSPSKDHTGQLEVEKGSTKHVVCIHTYDCMVRSTHLWERRKVKRERERERERGRWKEGREGKKPIGSRSCCFELLPTYLL